jgi:hypothetical protein
LPFIFEFWPGLEICERSALVLFVAAENADIQGKHQGQTMYKPHKKIERSTLVDGDIRPSWLSSLTRNSKIANPAAIFLVFPGSVQKLVSTLAKLASNTFTLLKCERRHAETKMPRQSRPHGQKAHAASR